MRIRKFFIWGALLVIGLPVALGLVVAATIWVLDESSGAIATSGRERRYLLHVPRSYDRAKPAALVIGLHGAAGWPAQQMNLSRWNRLADEHGFIAVYPSGTGVPRIWRSDDADIRFISELIDTLRASYNIDPARIYANGFSNGGGMALALSCGLPDRIAAIGTVGPALLFPSKWCTGTRPMPLISFHGTADPLAPYNGGITPASPPRFIHGKTIPFESVATWKSYWAKRNRCGPSPAESVVAADVTRIDYTGCADNAAVVVYTIDGGGHTWPGGKEIPMTEWWVGSTSRSIDATRLMWAFFQEHPLPKGEKP